MDAHAASSVLCSLRIWNVPDQWLTHNPHPADPDRTSEARLPETFLYIRSYDLKEMEHMYPHLTAQILGVLRTASGQNQVHAPRSLDASQMPA